MNSLAIHGGKPVRQKLFPGHNFIGDEEKRAVMAVLDSGNLSQFIGCWHDDFYGGPRVREFEKVWADTFDVRHAVSVNSNTSGLVAAIGAAGVGPGDEVIVPPYTMAASATAILAYNGVPVFCDIEPETFCIDPEKIRAKISDRTRAIMVVHLLGHPAPMEAILKIAREHNLVVIEDAAQAPGATYHGKLIGGLGDMTVFSLNYHKHIHTGEGGVVTTNSDEFAERLQLIRNHGEAVVGPKGVKNLVNTFGYNFRFTEIAAAIGTAQLAKLPALLERRLENAAFLNERVGALPGLRAPIVKPDCKHVYYVQGFLFDEAVVGVSRDRFVAAVAAELPLPEDRQWPLISAGYGTPLYLLPMYQQRVANGPNGHPFAWASRSEATDYRPGLCPVTESVNAQMIGTEFMRPPCTLDDMADVAAAFEKVYERRSELA
jgi:dTDP-4-amino-4,6-dideoxygalactose transaminase